MGEACADTAPEKSLEVQILTNGLCEPFQDYLLAIRPSFSNDVAESTENPGKVLGGVRLLAEGGGVDRVEEVLPVVHHRLHT
jgi:hypothetical protein